MFDTLKYAKELEAVGVSRSQAEAHIRIISDIVEGDLATKQDIRDIRADLKEVEYRLVITLGAIVAGVVALAATIIVAVIKIQ